MPQRRLGKGVSALFQDDIDRFPHSARMVPIEHIHPNPHQPRTHFDAQKITELAASIKSYGIIQPLVVEERGLDDYIIIAGERRLRAARQARITDIPVICRKSGETERLEIALIENIQRTELNPIEEARAYRAILDGTTLTQDQLSARMGKARSTITNTMRMLALPEEIQALISRGALSAGHARALLSIDDVRIQRETAEEIVQKKLSVRESERIAQLHAHTPQKKAAQKTASKDPYYELMAVEGRMRDQLITKVKIQGDNQKGKISIYYHSLNDLNRIYRHICRADD